jgi:hypothetical protein
MKAHESADCAVLCLATCLLSLARHKTAQSALSSAFMVKKRILNNSDLASWVCVVWRGRLKAKLLNGMSEM